METHGLHRHGIVMPSSTIMDRVLLKIALLLLCIVLTSGYEPDRIKSFPGQPDGYSFRQHGGYVTIDETTGKSFYYIFVEAESKPSRKPVVLWLNGGPGCSSVYNGFMEEHGPWSLTGFKTNQLKRNPFSWNKVANIIYLESPAGVGFSYSNSTSDYMSDDLQTAADNYVFLAGWFKKFPHFKSNQFFISGESYAGHYIPFLADEILKRDASPSQSPVYTKLNFQGFIIGNPYTRVFEDAYWIEVLYARYIISTAQFNRFNRACRLRRDPEACLSTYFDIYNALGNENVYDLTADVCNSAADSSIPLDSSLFRRSKMLHFRKASSVKPQASLHKATGDKGRRLKSGKGRAAPSTVPKPFSLESPFCVDYWVFKYLNDGPRQKAIHAKLTGAASDFYIPCSRSLQYFTVSSTLPLFSKFFAKGLRVWLFSGDADTVVPFTVTREDAVSFNRTQLQNSTLWYYFDQPGGSTQVFDGFSTVTVRDAGHLVPVRQPERALFVLERFLAGQEMPTQRFSRDTTP